MKTVFTTSEVAHIWANANQREGRNSARRVYFEDGLLYSYGSHYLTGARFGDLVFLNADSNSVSTNRHRSDARGASRHREQIFLPDLTNLRDALRSVAIARYSDPNATLEATGWRYDDTMRYVGKHALEVTQNDVARLLGVLYGLTPKQSAAIHQKAVKAAQKQAIADKKAQAQRDKRDAANFVSHLPPLADLLASKEPVMIPYLASYSRDTYDANELGRQDSKYDYKTSSYKTSWPEYGNNLPQLVLRLNKRLAFVRKHGTKAQAAKFWPYVKAFRERLKAMEKRVDIDAFHKQLKVRMDAVRLWNETLLREGDYEAYMVATQNALDSFRAYLRLRPHAKDKAAITRFLEYFDSSYELGKAEHLRREAILAEARAKADMEAKRERFEAWRNGDYVPTYSLPVHPKGDYFAFLRIKGGNVETSKGAIVPLEHAVKLYRFMKAIKQPWEGKAESPVRVGHYTLESVKDDVAKIGCHKLHMSDMDALYEAYQAMVAA